MAGKTKTKKKKKQRLIRPRLRLKESPDKIDYSALMWYPDATRLIKDLYGEHWTLFVDILAATSPRQSVKKNWKMAVSILSAYINRKTASDKFGYLLGSLMPSHANNVIRALQGRPIKGPKVSRFAENLKGNLDVVTIDMWICKAYGIEHSRLTAKVYEQLEAKIIKEATAANARPANYQALIWYCVRRLNGKRTKSFVSVYRSIFMETPYFEFMAD